MKTETCDFLIAGSGIAGLLTALQLASHGKVLVVTKKESADSNTNNAQGGISCVTAETDDFEKHIADTLTAGAGLCNSDVVRKIVTAAPEGIERLIQTGVSFHKADSGQYDLGREGGHGERRILHAGDITGRHIEEVLLHSVRQHPQITMLEYAMMIDTVVQGGRVIGAYVLNSLSGEIFGIRARETILSTGGCGKVYLYTSNPDIATGDGVAIAWRAGAEIADMEFIQFHPTCLFHPKARNFLVSEAVRGEGAELVDRNGQPFMHKYDARGALAPRDVVARAIDAEMKRTAAPYCCLDIRHKSHEFLQTRFPNIFAKCLEFGIDMSRDLIPVVPAAHYCCGGVKTDVAGATSVPGLSAVGETACTGLHGANRLASNSLLEALVCAEKTAARLIANKQSAPPADTAPLEDWIYGNAVESDEAVVISHNWAEIRTLMWDYVGIVRTNKRLERALRRIDNLRDEIRQYYFDYLVTLPMLELRNLADVANLIIRSAQLRKESRGLHFTLDYPDKAPELKHTILKVER